MRAHGNCSTAHIQYVVYRNEKLFQDASLRKSETAIASLIASLQVSNNQSILLNETEPLTISFMSAVTDKQVREVKDTRAVMYMTVIY